MRKVRLLAVGNIKEKFFKEAVDEYAKRLAKFCEFSITELPEFVGAGGLEREADHILKHIDGNVVLFDRLGKEPTSEEFASLVEKCYLSSPIITFVIGGSDGVADRVRIGSQHKISFGRVTYPHRLMRLIAVEQIYRAFTIIEKMPYHK